MTHLSNCSNDTALFSGFVSLTQRMEKSKKGFHPYITVHTKPTSVIIIPIRNDGAFLATWEMRYAVHKRVLSFPAGLVDDTESVLEAAKRELLEETGCRSECWIQIGSCFPLPGLLHQTTYVFVATNIEVCQRPNLDGVEDIESEFLQIHDLQQAFCKGGDIDATALAAFALFKLGVSCKYQQEHPKTPVPLDEDLILWLIKKQPIS